MKRIKKSIYNFSLKLSNSQILLLFFSEIIIGVLLSIFSFLLFTKIARNILNYSYFNFDLYVSGLIYAIRNPALTSLMMLISFLGKDIFLAAISVISSIYLIKKRYIHELFLLYFTISIGVIINLGIKFFIGRPRPLLSPLVNESFFSFPSGHAMNSFVVFGILAFFVYRFTKNKTIGLITAGACIFLVFVIGLSRIYLGVHYPTDVLAGFIGGFWWIVTIIVVEKTVIFLKLFKNN